MTSGFVYKLKDFARGKFIRKVYFKNSKSILVPFITHERFWFS